MIKLEHSLSLIPIIALVINSISFAQLCRDQSPLFEAVGSRSGSKLGYQVAGLGDQNGDGFDDILVSAPGDRKAFIYFGGSPMDTIPDIVFHKEKENLFGYRICNLGDVNGDSFIDFAISSSEWVRVYWGGDIIDTTADLILPSNYEICAAGDVNGDGFDDILRSDINWQSGRGITYLYIGGLNPDSIADWSASGDSAGYNFGYNISGNGDINGDGYSDMAIGGYRQLNRGIYPYVKLFYGSDGIDTLLSLVMDSFEQQLDISSHTTFINVNGDDFSDICIDCHTDTAAFLFYGPMNQDVIPDLILHGSSLSGKIWEISNAGDINNDGYFDIIIGDYDAWNNTGEVLIFLGGPHMDGKYDIGFTGFMQSYEGAGRSVGRAGDVNGDGVDDILFGAWVDYGDNKQGRVMIFSGDTTLSLVSPNSIDVNEPSSFLLKQNYPNPFNESTTINYQISIDQPTRVVLKIFNISGQEVVTLFDGLRDSGTYQVLWNGRDNLGTDIGSAIYLCQLKVGESIQCKKIVLLK